MLSRRSFLGGAIVLAAATVLPMDAFASVPTIYGDGVHDDTAGLNALFDGKPFRVAGSAEGKVFRTDGQVTINGGTFRISRTLMVGSNTRITRSKFHLDGASRRGGLGLVVKGGGFVGDCAFIDDRFLGLAGGYTVAATGRPAIRVPI